MAKVEFLGKDDGKMKFTLSGVDVSYANGLRRLILSEIPIVGFKTMPYEQNKATIITNTTRLNNEVIKQRLSCIPVCIKNVNDPNLSNYILEVNVENNTDTSLIVTTKDFKIKNISTNKYLDDSLVRDIFPPYNAPNGNEYFIDFVRLRPRISDEIPGEKINLTCLMSVVTAKEDSAYNVVGTCSYGFTPDRDKIEEEVSKLKQKWKDDGLIEDDIEFKAKNWKLLEGLRYVYKNSFDYVIESVGIYDNEEIMIKSCNILLSKLNNIKQMILEDDIEIIESLSTLENSYDIILKNEDYTIGNILNYELYSQHYENTKILNYVGFKKKHPHDTDSLLRIAFSEKPDSRQTVIVLLTDAIDSALKKVNEIKHCFDGSE